MSSDMGSSTAVCADNQHKFYPSHHQHLYFNKKSLRDIDIPPRKLLSRRSAAAAAVATDHMFLMDSPKGGGDYEGLLQKFLPYNDEEEDVSDADPYSSDHFRMYEFKVRKCTRSRSHDWTDCPFAHPGEKARRRDPRRFHYTGTVCAEFRRGSCSRGDNCEFAHGVFECWLHPSRYRTEACKDGKNCNRKVCFFAHTPRQLRVLPVNCHENVTTASSSPVSLEKNNKHKNNAVNHCCVYCHHSVAAAAVAAAASSPTSTLMGMSHLSPPMSPSHSLSPPLSPGKAASSGGFSPYKVDSHHHTRHHLGLIPQFNSSSTCSSSTLMSYKDALTELISSLEAMQVNESPPSTSHSSAAAAAINSGNLRWLDVNFLNPDDQQQFILSPSTPTTPSSKLFLNLPTGNNNNNNIPTMNFFEENKYDFDGGFGTAPDLGWVNDLLT